MTKGGIVELNHHPETDLEYWEAIDGLGGFSWHMNHDLADGRITDTEGRVDQAIEEIKELSKTLVEEIEEKFGVIPPSKCPQTEEKPPAPTGKVYYWDWYKKMKRRYYQKEYEGIICSACPFSEGVEVMIAMGGGIPCSFKNPTLLGGRITIPWRCPILESINEARFFKELQEKAVKVFKEKMERLQEAYNKSQSGD